MNTEIVTVDQLKLRDVVRLPEGNVEVVFIKVMPKTTQITFQRERGAFSGGRKVNTTSYTRFVAEEQKAPYTSRELADMNAEYQQLKRDLDTYIGNPSHTTDEHITDLALKAHRAGVKLKLAMDDVREFNGRARVHS